MYQHRSKPSLRSVVEPSIICAIVCAILFWHTSAPAQVSRDELDVAFQQLRVYESGKSTDFMATIREHVKFTDSASGTRWDLERRFVDVIRSRGASDEAKSFAQEQWFRILSRRSVPVLEEMLLSRDTAPIGVEGLRRLPYPNAQEALVDALENTGGDTLLDIIRVLGERQDPSGVNGLRRLAGGGNNTIAIAAIAALAEIGGMEAAEALDWCRQNLGRAYRGTVTQAYLRCADVTRELGDVVTAIDIYEELFSETEPDNVRQQALAGLIKAEGEDSIPLVIDVLQGTDPKMREVAARAAATIPGTDVTEALMDAFHRFDAANQVRLIGMLAERGDRVAIPLLNLAAKHRERPVRVAALKALGVFNDDETLQTLLKAVAVADGEELEAAKNSLAQLDAPNVDEALVRAAMSADNAIRMAAVQTMVARNATNGVPVLIRLAQRDVEAIRLEALRALGILASPEDLKAVVALLGDAGSPASRDAAKEAVIQVAAKVQDGARLDAVYEALKDGDYGPEEQVALIEAIRRVGDDEALPSLRAALKRRDKDVQVAAIQALAQWPNAAPLPDLERIARKEEDEPQRRMAFEGWMRLLRLDTERPVQERIKDYENAAEVARSTAEKRMIVDALASLNDPGVLDLLETFEKDPALREQALAAKESIQGTSG